MNLRQGALIAVLTVAACTPSSYRPQLHPAPAPARIVGDFDAIWQAVVDVATETHLALVLLDRPSGYLRAERTRIPEPTRDAWWDCGKDWGTGPFPSFEPSAEMAIAITRQRGDTVQIRLAVMGLVQGVSQICTSRGVFERVFLETVRSRLAIRP